MSRIKPFSSDILNEVLIKCAPLLILAYGLFYLCYGEPCYVNGGLLYDAHTYAAYVQDFWGSLKKIGVDDYHATRLFPSYVVYLFSHILHYNLNTPASIYNAFCLYNTILLTCSVWLWFLIVKQSSFSKKIFWLGFFSLFINAPGLKIDFYYPVATDVTAFFFGMLLLYFYIKQRPILFCIAAFFASFTWQVSIYLAFLLMFNSNKEAILSSTSRLDRYLPYFAVFMFLLGVIYYNILDPHMLSSGAAQVDKVFLPLSSILASVYIFYIAKYSNFVALSAVNFKNIHIFKKPVIYVFLITAFAYFGLLHWLRHKYGVPSSFGVDTQISFVFITSIAKPMIFFIAHVMFWGPIFVLFIFQLKSILRIAWENDYAIFLFLIVMLIMSLISESRMMTISFPIFVYLVCQGLMSRKISWGFVIFYGLLSLSISRFYIPMNPHPLFPLQHMVAIMLAPWWDWQVYLFNAMIFLFVLIAIFFYWRKMEVLGTEKQVNNRRNDRVVEPA